MWLMRHNEKEGQHNDDHDRGEWCRVSFISDSETLKLASQNLTRILEEGE